MPPRLISGRLDDPTALAPAEAALRIWEPRLDLVLIRDEPALFEPDGVLYGLVLVPTTIHARHKPRRAEIGDLIVVPRAVGIEADPGFTLLGVRHDGVPPYHFRERFIQTWAYDHLQVPPLPEVAGQEIILGRDGTRYRIGYRRITVGDEPWFGTVGPDLQIVIPLIGRGFLNSGESSGSVDLNIGSFVLSIPPATFQVHGPITFALIEIADEVSFEATRALRHGDLVNPPSPEL